MKKTAGPPSQEQPLTRDQALRAQIAERIRWARQEKRLTLDELAQRVGFANYKPAWLIESGRMPLPPEKIAALEEALDFPRFSLFWAECRCRLLRMGFDVDAALEQMEAGPEPAGAAQKPAPPDPAETEPATSIPTI